MKRMITTILPLMALALVTGCGSAAKDVSETLYEQGLEITRRMDELASSKAYAEAMSASAELSALLIELTGISGIEAAGITLPA